VQPLGPLANGLLNAAPPQVSSRLSQPVVGGEAGRVLHVC
jgi:hypothetical protein